MNNDILKRLAFIKQLYLISIESSFKPEPICSMAILLFHDSIEFFLQLVIQYKNISKTDINLMEYWEILEKKNIILTRKEEIRKLNKSRGQLKHHGIHPSKYDIDSFRNSVINFFIENNNSIFGVNFEKLNLIDIIEYDDVKENLKIASEFIDKDEIESALEKIALSFVIMINNYEASKVNYNGDSPFNFIRKKYIYHDTVKDEGINKIIDDITHLNQSIATLHEIIKILCLGIDPKKYIKFIMLTPRVDVYTKKIFDQSFNTKKVTKDDAEFCLNFIIESYLYLKDFDFNLDVSIYKKWNDFF